MLREGEDAVAGIKVRHAALFHQALGNGFQGFIALKIIRQFHAYQIIKTRFYRQAAAQRLALFAQAFAVTGPAVGLLDVGGAVVVHGGRLRRFQQLTRVSTCFFSNGFAA